MLIDWFTIVAQIVNFLILVWLLRRFLYGPILRAMEGREARIAAQSAEALAAKQAAEQEAAEYRRRQAALEEEREEVLSAAKLEADDRRKALIAEARRELEEARAGWYHSIQAEQNAFLREVRQRLGSQLCAISRRALVDLADVELETRMIQVFVRRLAALEPAERKRLTGSARKAGREIAVRSAFPIPESARQEIAQTLHDGIAEQAGLHFSEDADLLCGVELSVHDHKIAWTLADYLTGLEADLLERLDGEIDSGRRSGALENSGLLLEEEQAHAG